MRSRQLLATLLVASLLVLSGCLGAFQPAASNTDAGGAVVQATNATVANETAATELSVSGTGEVSAEADLAVVFLSVTALADSADSARQQVAVDADNVTAALVDAGVAEDAIQTTSFSISPEYDFSNGTRTLVGYRAVHSFRVEVSPDAAGQVIDVAVGNGADTVDGVSFTLTDETRADLRQQALSAAVRDARTDAETVAGAAGLSITGVERIDVGGDVTPFEPVFREASAAGDTTLRPGPVTVTATVSVTYTAAESQ